MSLIAQLLENSENHQKKMIQESFAKVAPISEQAAEIFYDKLFKLDPTLKPLFSNDMKEQGRKLMAMLGTAVKGLDRPETIIPAIQELGKRHVGYGVKDAHYDTVGAALLFTLETGLGEAWNAELEEAWTALYVDVAGTMKQAAGSTAA